MPVERSRGHAGRALAVAGVGVAVVGLALWGVAVLTSRTDSFDVRLGDQTFQGGDAERLAEEIADRGPIIYGDVSDNDRGETRDIILQHLGDDPDEGWYAFRAQVPPYTDRACAWVWQPDDQRFRSSEACPEDLTAPADGTGLERYPVEVDDGTLDIDLNFERRPDETTTTAIESGDVPEPDPEPTPTSEG